LFISVLILSEANFMTLIFFASREMLTTPFSFFSGVLAASADLP
jgi:hypothetical protein